MSKRKLVLRGVLTVVLAVVLVMALVVGGCDSDGGTAEDTLTIGSIAWLGSSSGLDQVRCCEIMANMINADGGLEVGGTRYEIKIISYDSNFEQDTAVSATNRLVYEDGVKFIISDPWLVDAEFPITEAEGVVMCCGAIMPGMYSVDNRYSFDTAAMNATTALVVGWMLEYFPEYTNVVVATADTAASRAFVDPVQGLCEEYGVTLEAVYYPSDATDLSSVATKVKTLAPDVFMATGGGASMDALAYKAVYEAGFEGQFIVPGTNSVDTLAQVIPMEALEGIIGAAYPVEFDPALTDSAQEFKDAWIAEYGEWSSPELIGLLNFSALITAIQEADTLDTDAVAAVLGNGLQFDGPGGVAQMVSRPDLGIDWTIDSVLSLPVKQVIDGEIVLIDTIEIDDAIIYFHNIYSSD